VVTKCSLDTGLAHLFDVCPRNPRCSKHKCPLRERSRDSMERYSNPAQNEKVDKKK
jgi:hypothetical protein